MSTLDEREAGFNALSHAESTATIDLAKAYEHATMCVRGCRGRPDELLILLEVLQAWKQKRDALEDATRAVRRFIWDPPTSTFVQGDKPR